MFGNFIALSIIHKKNQIGILRAIGSRANDIFRIFFSEAFVIAIINFAIAAVGTNVVAFTMNSLLRNQGLPISPLSVGPLQYLAILAVCLLVAFGASFLPVRAIARKTPIDSIRDR